jgi:hypothetical protein
MMQKSSNQTLSGERGWGGEEEKAKNKDAVKKIYFTKFAQKNLLPGKLNNIHLLTIIKVTTIFFNFKSLRGNIKRCLNIVPWII